jgi:long-chain acyl-CoA synthetase
LKKLTLYETDYYDNFAAFVKGIGEKYQEAPGVSWYSRDGKETCVNFRALCSRVFSLREALCAHGLNGKHIAILGENSYDWLVAYLAITSCGSVAVCIDVEQSEASLIDMVRRSDAAAVFASPTFLPTIRQMPGESGSLPRLLCLGTDEEGGAEASIDDWCAEGERILASGAGQAESLTIDGEKAAVIVFTSGTTSQPKMVMLSHKGILLNTSECVRYVYGEKSIFTPLPFYHTYGMTCAVLSILMRGAHLYINGDLKTMTRDLHLAQPDTLLAVPLIVETLYNQIWLAAEKAGKAGQLRKLIQFSTALRKLGIRCQFKKLDAVRRKAVGNLHIIVSGGAHLSKKISEDLEQLGILILQGYGITECSPLISANNNGYYKHGTVGHVLTSFDLKLVDDEIWVKGPSVMLGYYKDPEGTREAMVDGWFKTGDLGYLDKNGFLYLTGRKKNLIVFQNGKKLSPEKLEELIRPLPLVKDVIVQGAVNGSSSDDVKLTASIFPDPAQTEDMSSYEILTALQKEIDRINDTLPSYQQIKMLNIREQEFERTSSKKIKRHLV